MARFIDRSQVVTTDKYNTITDFHTTKHSTLELLSYNETALAITPDDGPMRPKHVVVE
jgi:hypothetical protein